MDGKVHWVELLDSPGWDISLSAVDFFPSVTVKLLSVSNDRKSHANLKQFEKLWFQVFRFLSMSGWRLFLWWRLWNTRGKRDLQSQLLWHTNKVTYYIKIVCWNLSVKINILVISCVVLMICLHLYFDNKLVVDYHTVACLRLFQVWK